MRISVHHCRAVFKSEFALLVDRAAPSRAQNMSQWLDSIA
jgi:hypothetical protein